MLAYAVLAWLLIGIGLVVTGGNIEAAVALVAPGEPDPLPGAAPRSSLSSPGCTCARTDGRAAEPLPAVPIAAVLAAIALAAEMLQSQLPTALPLGSVQLVIATVVATTMLIDWGLSRRRRPSRKTAPTAQSSGLNR